MIALRRWLSPTLLVAAISASLLIIIGSNLALLNTVSVHISVWGKSLQTVAADELPFAKIQKYFHYYLLLVPYRHQIETHL